MNQRENIAVMQVLKSGQPQLRVDFSCHQSA